MTLSAAPISRRASPLARRTLAPAHRLQTRWHLSQREVLIAALSAIVALTLLVTTVDHQTLGRFGPALIPLDAAAAPNAVLLQSFLWVLPVLHTALTP